MGFSATQIFVAYRGEPTRTKQWAQGGKHVLVAQADLEPDVASQVWEAAGWPVIGKRGEIPSSEDRSLLMHAGRAVRARIGAEMRAALCSEIGRADLPEWAEGELQRRVEADPRSVALAGFVGLWEGALADGTIRVWWTQG